MTVAVSAVEIEASEEFRFFTAGFRNGRKDIG
jgi:hypothetical protein